MRIYLGLPASHGGARFARPPSGSGRGTPASSRRALDGPLPYRAAAGARGAITKPSNRRSRLASGGSRTEMDGTRAALACFLKTLANGALAIESPWNTSESSFVAASALPAVASHGRSPWVRPSIVGWISAFELRCGKMLDTPRRVLAGLHEPARNRRRSSCVPAEYAGQARRGILVRPCFHQAQ